MKAEEYHAAKEQEGRAALDPWHQQIAEFVKSKPVGAAFTTAEVLDRLGVDESHRERSHEMRVENVLRELRWLKAEEYLEHELEYLETYRAGWEAGMWTALAQTIHYCDGAQIPLPEWASGALLTIQDFFPRALEDYRAMWEAGMWQAFFEAMTCCHAFGIPPPEWVFRAQLKIMQDHYLIATASTRRGPYASAKGRQGADYAHYLRFLAVGAVLRAHNLTDLPSQKGRRPPGTATKAGLLAEAPDILRRLKVEKQAGLGTKGVAGKLEKSFKLVLRSRLNGEARFKFGHLLM